ncbi:hypothetical protein PHYSODRAFT_496158 [Phytophthora sojae]|uniref:Phytotoxin PcF domain-containing protein n=1 Tax=Phytophthora sojae (strain P6497) TaxID=1094619 RepID=G4Z3D8_PHYSP|nr:hypothetical protein PHYSODRAFT_496158 [Phytophthora sojae]EGZ21501.1 hypothetical protein PHYSODRAFT_496158 [Phytophthora sojae]|eukprot:XP_009524218.1 hypothetical protein PHYSODRAFT_496158 [Phytophthora sojae]
MKLQTVIVALAALLVPIQCAGVDFGMGYESSGFLTADFTTKACAQTGGAIVYGRKGNQKCCEFPDARKDVFDYRCKGQSADAKYYVYRPVAKAC